MSGQCSVSWLIKREVRQLYRSLRRTFKQVQEGETLYIRDFTCDNGAPDVYYNLRGTRRPLLLEQRLCQVCTACARPAALHLAHVCAHITRAASRTLM